MRILYRLGLMLPALMLAACASVSELPAPPEGQGAALVVYQPSSSYSITAQPFLYVDGHLQGQMEAGGVFNLRIEAGDHRISMREPILLWPGQEDAVTNITAKTGQTTYVRFLRQQVGVSLDSSNNPRAEVRSSLSEVGVEQGAAHE